jgi:hypothetical protein
MDVAKVGIIDTNACCCDAAEGLNRHMGEARRRESEFRMDESIQAFLRAVVDLEGNFHAEVREGVRICLADYERKFPDIPRASYRERVVEEIARQKGTPTEHHLRIVLEAIDDSARFPLEGK